jgi:predicted nucleic acid-binding protein
MILVDTGALYALGDRNDAHHREAAEFLRLTKSHDAFAMPVSVLIEAALLVEARLGMEYVRRLWDDVLAGVFDLLAVTPETLGLARQIDQRYRDARLGLVDCTCLALCEQHRISTVFTYDRRDFALYRPTFAKALTLVP